MLLFGKHSSWRLSQPLFNRPSSLPLRKLMSLAILSVSSEPAHKIQVHGGIYDGLCE